MIVQIVMSIENFIINHKIHFKLTIVPYNKTTKIMGEYIVNKKRILSFIGLIVILIVVIVMLSDYSHTLQQQSGGSIDTHSH